MKKLLLSALLVGLTASGFAQGQVAIRNIFNSDPSSSATANGLVFLNNGTTTAPIGTDFNFAFYGGSASDALTVIRTYAGAAANGDNAAGPGTFFTSDIMTIPGATASAFFKLEAWTGSAATFAAAQSAGTAGTYGGFSTVFVNPLGNPNASPPGTPAELSGMPAVTLAGFSVIPEPGTFALAGLGAAALLIFRRRK